MFLFSIALKSSRQSDHGSVVAWLQWSNSLISPIITFILFIIISSYWSYILVFH